MQVVDRGMSVPDYPQPSFFETTIIEGPGGPITHLDIERIMEQPRFDWRDVLARVDEAYYTRKCNGWGKPKDGVKYHWFLPLPIQPDQGPTQVIALCKTWGGEDSPVYAGVHGIVLHRDVTENRCARCVAILEF